MENSDDNDIEGISVILKTIAKYYTFTRTKEQIENVQLLR